MEMVEVVEIMEDEMVELEVVVVEEELKVDF